MTVRGAPRVVMLAETFWSSAFARDPTIVGRTLRISGQPYTVVGVVPARFRGLGVVIQPKIWTALRWADDVEPITIQSITPSAGDTRFERRGQRWLFLTGRLRDGATLTEAGAELQAVMNGLGDAYPDVNGGRRITVRATKDIGLIAQADGPLKLATISLITLMNLVLLIGCANVAGLLLARASARRREIGIRLAIGAARARVMRQLLIESTLLSLLGGAGGIAIAWGLLRLLAAFRPPLPVPVTFDFELDAGLLGLAVAMGLLSGLLAGVTPAWSATRASVVDELAGHSRGSIGRRWNGRAALVTGQVAVSVVLLVITGLLARNLVEARQIDPGFRVDNVAALTAGVGLIGYDDERGAQFFDRVMARVRRLPGVDRVALAAREPLAIPFNVTTIRRADRAGPDDAELRTITTTVSDEYFRLLEIPLLEGRGFDHVRDTSDSPRVAIVNEALVRRLWPGSALRAVGQRFVLRDDTTEVEIVGVVPNYKVRFLHEAPTPYIHYAMSQWRGRTGRGAPRHGERRRRDAGIPPGARAAPDRAGRRFSRGAHDAGETGHPVAARAGRRGEPRGGRARGHRTGGGRTLRYACVRRRAADARDRHSRRAWRHASPGAARGARSRAGGRRRRNGRRLRPRLSGRQGYRRRALRDQRR